jgi:glycosyltransferase involved in cell wall biosynthesis
MKPRLTVAISFHDEERYLEAAVRSVLAQSFEDFELLLIDDGSTDRSLEIARGFLGDARVRVFTDGARRHLAARLNEVVRRARGELVARMDADDVMHPEKLALQVAHLDREPACQAVGTSAALVDEDEVAFGVIEVAPITADDRRLLERPPIPHATMMARAGWLGAHPYDETLTRAEDRDLWCRTRGTRIDAIEDVLYVVRVLPHRRGFASDYVQGQADLRRVLLRYGPELGGWLVTARLVGSSLLKSATMRVVDLAGWTDVIVSRRGRAPTAKELVRVDEALATTRHSA